MKKCLALFMVCWSSMLPAGAKVDLLKQIPLIPAPQMVQDDGDRFPFPGRISIQVGPLQDAEQRRAISGLIDLLSTMPGVETVLDRPADFAIAFTHDPAVVHPEGYVLRITRSGAAIHARTAAGRFYALQTLHQILGFSYYGPGFLYEGEEPELPDAGEKKYVPAWTIHDYPRYPMRSLMLDMGRAVFSKAYVQRIIRIMAHLKLNTLHLHLYDDEIGGYRFDSLPLGKENPLALTKTDLQELVRYARDYHIAILPEIESWGHVKSVVYHYPELYGGPGMYGGASFAVGEKTFAVLEKMYGEIADCLPDTAAIHVGLDEARWFVAPGEADKSYTPEKLVTIIYDLVQKVARERGKHLTMHMWADHKGRPIPAQIGPNLVLQPWKYRHADQERIVQAMSQYGGKDKRPVMMGAGITSACRSGDFAATRLWCLAGDAYPNVLGATLCLWGTNNLADRLIMLYAGASYLWSPRNLQPAEEDPYSEDLRFRFERNMQNWQLLFPDAAEAALDFDRGPEVFLGRYLQPPFNGKAVAPTLEYKP